MGLFGAAEGGIADSSRLAAIGSTLTSLLVGFLVFLLMLPVGCGDPSANSGGVVTAVAAASVDAAPPALEAWAEAGDGGEAVVVADEDKLSSQELEELVGRIALYPDELVAQVLPAATFPLDLVEAARFLEVNEGASEPPEDAAWDPSVISLLAFPSVLAMMSDDIAWTRQLGDALWAQEADVYDAIQAFRRRVEAAGNLESNEKVVVMTEKETITIVPAKPEVVYVPVYQPQTVVVHQTSVAPLIVWGSAIAFTAWAYSISWGRHHPPPPRPLPPALRSALQPPSLQEAPQALPVLLQVRTPGSELEALPPPRIGTPRLQRP